MSGPPRIAVFRAATLGIVAAIGIGAVIWARNGQESVPVTITYEEFTAAAAELNYPYTGAPGEDLISFPPPETEIFQTIRANPSGWRPLIERMVADPSVPQGVKFGTIGALGDLPPAERAAFLMVLLDEADRDPAAILLADFFAGNLWRASSFLRSDLIAEDSLFDHRGQTDVRAALERLWRHPALPPHKRDENGMLYGIFGPWEG